MDRIYAKGGDDGQHNRYHDQYDRTDAHKESEYKHNEVDQQQERDLAHIRGEYKIEDRLRHLFHDDQKSEESRRHRYGKDKGTGFHGFIDDAPKLPGIHITVDKQADDAGIDDGNRRGFRRGADSAVNHAQDSPPA